MNIKVNFDSIEVKEDKNDFNVKVLMLKGEKGDPGDGEDNVIEKVQVNGTDLPVTNKTVNVPVPIVDSSISSSSTNPVQNSAIYNALSNKVNNSALDNYYEISEVDGFLNNKADVSIVDKKPYYFDNVASMKAYNLKNGDYVITKGYYSANDGGHGEYIIVNDNELVADNGLIHTLTNGLKAKLIIENVINVKQFGAYGDNTHDDTESINNAVNSGAKIIIFSKDEYLVSDRIEIIEKNNISILGNGCTLIVDESVSESEQPIYDRALVKGYKCNNINIENLNIDGSKTFYYRTDDTTGEYAENTALYLAHRSTGFSGINFETSDNITIKNCTVKNTCSGIGYKNTTNSIIDNCQVLYTTADAYQIYYGNQNITVENCYCYNNGDDAFSVFSLKKYWNYEETEVDVDQNENIHFINCRSVNNRARGFINEGGKNIFYENCIFDNVNWCFYIGTYSNTEYDTNNTFINNCIFNSAEQPGITSVYRATVEKANDVYFSNCQFNSSDTIASHQQFRIGTTSNLYITDSNLKDIIFTNLSGTSQKVKLVNVNVESYGYCEFNITTLELDNCNFINTHDGNQGIWFPACTNITTKNLKLSNGKYLIGTFTNIVTDNIENFYSGSLSGTNVKITSPIMTTTAITNGSFESGDVQIVKGIPRYYDNNQWKIPLFLPVGDVIGGGTSLNTLYGIDGVKVNICTTGATDRPPDNEMFFIITIESAGANVKSQIAISISNSSLLYTRNGTGSWVSH